MMACWFGHSWNPWQKIGEGILHMEINPLTGEKLKDGENYQRGVFEYQRRTCEICGKSQLRRAHA